ncbi:MAG: guanine deaminase [Kaiparowitsia implicata GSE-PSE-MK54-09C]|jgi:guanine deaminase|nr:guanine deaminase [Kaiparowitsia implicata GSE-PSE-MK54-09C]
MCSLQAFRASILDFIDDPFYATLADSVRYFPDGLLVLEDGHVHAFGHYPDLHSQYANCPIVDYSNHLIMPGFVDLHVHYSQTEMIASYGKQLLDWLNTYTFPTERKFKELSYARQIASMFCDELMRNGTTTALVFTTVFPQSVDAFFEEAQQRNLRMIAGKVMMNRHAPDYLTDTAETAYTETKTLIERWHKQNRLLYAVTPRFAITSTPEQLQRAGQLLREFPDVYVHTHLSENVKEVAWVKELFPQAAGYLDVYDQAGLVGDRSIFAHGVQLTDAEFERMAQAGGAIAFCPTSNLFLGSGLFKIEQAKSTKTPIHVGLGSDVGGGTSLSILQTAHAAYEVAQLRQQTLSPYQILFLATLGGAKALKLDDKIGNFNVGKEADFVVLDPRATPIMALRNAAPTPTTLETLAEQLFALVMMGDDRSVRATYVMGAIAHSHDSATATPSAS